MALRIGVELVDLGGSFKRFLREAPKEMRARMGEAVHKTAFAMGKRVEAKAPVGPDSPHIRDAVKVEGRGLTYRVGFINATEPAGPANTSTIAEVALRNEYAPNSQSFMRPSAEAETEAFIRRMRDGLAQAASALTGGGLR